MESFLATHRMSTSNSQDVTIDEVMKVLRSQRSDSSSRIITMHPDATISEALRQLSDNRILSAPVVSSNNEFLAIVDMVDLVTVLVAAAISSGGNWTRADEVLKEKMADVLPVLRTYKQQDVGFLCDGIGTRQSVSAVVKRSFLNMHRHRIAINDCDAIVQDILSQSDILRFLQSTPEFRKSERQRALGDVGLGDTRPIVKVGTEEKVFTALKRMIDENVRTLAVVDSDNRLVSAFYINSLRGFGGGQLNLLEESVAEFTRRLGHSACEPLRCTVDTKLDTIISQLVKTRQHHAFLTDKDGHPTRVISQADVLNVLFGESALRDQ